MNLFRDAIELAFVVAVGGMVASAIKKLKGHEIHPYKCCACSRPTSRAYANCRHCGAPVRD